MNQPIAKTPVSRAIAGRGSPHLPGETGALVSLAEQRRWPFQVLGQAPMPEAPVRLGDWLLVPAQYDTSPIPERAMDRIQAIFTAGIRPQGFVLVHEAPKLLQAPVEPKVRPQVQPAPAPVTPRSPDRGGDFAGALEAGLTALGSLLFFLPYLFVAAVVVDPILCVVSQEGYWIEVDRWWTDGSR
jgi:hypothetical protein